jgi:hypothetical protein
MRFVASSRAGQFAVHGNDHRRYAPSRNIARRSELVTVWVDMRTATSFDPHASETTAPHERGAFLCIASFDDRTHGRGLLEVLR